MKIIWVGIDYVGDMGLLLFGKKHTVIDFSFSTLDIQLLALGVICQDYDGIASVWDMFVAC